MAKFFNPFAFRPRSVTVLTTLIYAALLIPLIVIHTTVPPPPKSATPLNGVNLTEAYNDLKLLTKFYHPYNSPANDDVRHFLLNRIQQILEANGANVNYPNEVNINGSRKYKAASEASEVYVFNDLASNISFSLQGYYGTAERLSVYFESSNIIVYVRGTEDDQTNWWEVKNKAPDGRGGVLVNAHYDSVSTGFGATDDGMGVVSVLQLIKYFSTSGHTPERGFVALLNNGEEEGLNGARAFGVHPLSKLPHTFVNLEGAGAGGRAHMFRATDVQVVEAYRSSPHPYSSVASGDAFNLGAIRSQTDYVVFNGDYGMRGMDISFSSPRARYHTDEDDTRHTGTDSLWHMLSAALATTRALTSDRSDKFDGQPNSEGKVPSGNGSNGVWFDLFGQGFAVAPLHTFFALSVTLLVVAPVVLLVTSMILHKVDRYYLFSGSRLYALADGDEEIKLYGWRGFFRFPVIFVISAAAPVALAFLVNKQNPFIIYSSEWAVWAMMFSSFFSVAWFTSCAAYFTRPSALTRVYGHIWLLVLFWAVLVANTVAETQLQLAGGFFFIFYFAAIFIVTLLAHLELFALPQKSKYCHEKMDGYESMGASQILSPERREHPADTGQEEDNDEEANESTSLLRGQRRQTFANYSHAQDEGDAEPQTPVAAHEETNGAYMNEQEWSASMPDWMWLLELIILAPIAVIFVTQIGLLFVSSISQTGADGGNTLLPYLFIAPTVILALLPLLPILHRLTWHIPFFLFLVLIGTLVYNLIAFPFSENNRLKLYFLQTLDIDTGLNNVTMRGPQPFLLQAISTLPSSQGHEISCGPVEVRRQAQLDQCSWSGLSPYVVPPSSRNESMLPIGKQFKTWVNVDTISPSPATISNNNSARFHISGRNTRNCKIVFEKPISDFRLIDSGPQSHKRFPSIPEGGTIDLKLWSRTWNRTWIVDVKWEDERDEAGLVPGLEGRVVCLWADSNQVGAIPALDEVRHYAPTWTTLTKAGDGLVEASKRFST